MDNKNRADEKRLDPRVTAEHSIHMMVALHGFDPADNHFEAKGITINLGHHGALVRVSRPMVEGSRCLVHLPDGIRQLGKTLIYGTVLRTTEIEESFEVAIEFDTRLQEISPGATLEDSLDGL